MGFKAGSGNKQLPANSKGQVMKPYLIGAFLLPLACTAYGETINFDSDVVGEPPEAGIAAVLAREHHAGRSSRTSQHPAPQMFSSSPAKQHFHGVSSRKA